MRRSRRSKLASIVSVVTGAEYDPADCNARTEASRAGTFDVEMIKAASLTYPETTDDGTLSRSEFVKASYRLAVARLCLADAAEGADTREFKYRIEEYTLRLAGWTMLQIQAKWRAEDDAARKAMEVPVSPSFKIPRRLLSSTHLTLVHSAVPAGAPSTAILRVA